MLTNTHVRGLFNATLLHSASELDKVCFSKGREHFSQVKSTLFTIYIVSKQLYQIQDRQIQKLSGFFKRVASPLQETHTHPHDLESTRIKLGSSCCSDVTILPTSCCFDSVFHNRTNKTVRQYWKY